MVSFRERLESDEVLCDNAIVSHGYAPHMRDYDVVVEAWTPGSYSAGLYRYRFTHCPEVRVLTTMRDEVWRESWDDIFIDFEEWNAAENPAGFVWGVNWAGAYPGLSYVPDSPLALSWTQRLGHEMHEVTIETNVYTLQLLCHGLLVHRLAVGDRSTKTLNRLDEPELV